MTHHGEGFSKSLAEPAPRRESPRRLGFALTDYFFWVIEQIPQEKRGSLP